MKEKIWRRRHFKGVVAKENERDNLCNYHYWCDVNLPYCPRIIKLFTIKSNTASHILTTD